MSVRAPQDELLRTQALEQYGILKHPPDPALDEIVRLAAQICDCPVGGIALSDGNHQVYKSVLGLRVFGPHDDKTPCEATLLADEILEIQDALSDSAFAPAGITLGIRNFRFYAGVPL